MKVAVDRGWKHKGRSRRCGLGECFAHIFLRWSELKRININNKNINDNKKKKKKKKKKNNKKHIINNIINNNTLLTMVLAIYFSSWMVVTMKSTTSATYQLQPVGKHTTTTRPPRLGRGGIFHLHRWCWLSHPSEKYARQMGWFPQTILGVDINKYLNYHHLDDNLWVIHLFFWERFNKS